MAEPTPRTVKGDFSNTRFAHAGETVEFLEDQGRYSVRVTQHGKKRTLPIRYTFGVEPLQQYLIDVGAGRLQALTVAWDARSKAAGGQRWFHLHGDVKPGPGDALHWEGPAYNWNGMCADCHSTGVVRGYRRENDDYQTRFAEINVSCEACHGPGSRHVAWATAPTKAPPDGNADRGFPVRLHKSSDRRWVLENGGTTALLRGRSGGQEIETCAPCHSRRSDLGPGKGSGYHDRYRVALLESELYYADGQIREEVFEYGSFLQSRMFARGVTCSDCHEPHSLKLRAAGNALCGSCHRASHYDEPRHHFHEAGSSGAECVNCHMPARTYMVVDPRRDHRFAVPRPTYSAKLGAPDACTQCHRSKSQAWAEREIAGRRQSGAPGPPAPSDALWFARTGQLGAVEALAGLVRDEHASVLLRATALAEFAEHPSGALPSLLRSATREQHPLLRRAAANAALSLAPSERAALLVPLLDDPVRSVRIEAASALLDVASNELGVRTREKLAAAVNEYASVRENNFDRAEALVDLADLARRSGRLERAEGLLNDAIRKDPTFAAGHLNLADLHRERGDEAAAIATLVSAVERTADRPMIEHALGLALIRVKRVPEGIVRLRAAYESSPDRVPYGYVYAVGLFESGKHALALEVLRKIHERRTGDAEVLRALAAYSRRSNHLEKAEMYERKLVELTRDSGHASP